MKNQALLPLNTWGALPGVRESDGLDRVMNTITAMLVKVTAIAICCGWVLVGCVSVAATAPPHADGCIATYEHDEQSLGGAVNIAFSDKRPAQMPSGRIEEAASPHGTGVLTTYVFDSMKAGSGRVIVAVQPRAAGMTYLSFEPARSVHARWLNERLIYIEAWWGRIAASEMIFDALEGRFLDRKLAHYAFALDPACAELENRRSEWRNEQ